MSRNYNNSSSNARNSDWDAVMQREMLQSVNSQPETQDVLFNRVRDVYPPIFRDLNPAEQLLPQMCEEFVENGLSMQAFENRGSVSLPDDFFWFNSAETTTLLSLLLDTSHTRMARMLDKVHIRAMWREDRYYQIVDDPQLYVRSKCTDQPAFHNRVVLYLTTPGVLIYLKQTTALSLLSEFRSKGILPRTDKMNDRREKRQSARLQSQSDFASVLEYERRKKDEMTPFLNIDAFQYATYVHCCEGDILRFQLDFLAVKRNYQEALPILMESEWQPNSPSLLLYRRKYYQYMTPFLDWVDVFRYHLKSSPTLSIAGFYEKILDFNSEHVDIDDLRLLGETMIESVELRRITKNNCPSLPNLHGMYAGRRIYKDSDPKEHSLLNNAFGKSRVVRPVLHHACSPMRRFLFHLNYYDRRNMVTLPQMLALVEFMLQQEFFTMHPICRNTGIHYEPMVFQIYDFIWSIRQGQVKDRVFLRHESWESIRRSEDGLAWYQRWDIFNSICLLFSVCQNAIELNIDGQVLERLIRIIIDVLRRSEFLECFFTYSYFDTYLGLNSTVNCVPNLSLNCYLRVLRTVPFHLCGSLNVCELQDTFSDRFWRSNTHCNSSGKLIERPRTMQEISEFLMTFQRRQSVQQAPGKESQTDKESGMSAMGSSGAVVVFYRDFNTMPYVDAEEEAATFFKDTKDMARRTAEETQHLAEFRQTEVDYRYGQIFTDAYYMATGRPRVLFNENMKYSECKALSMAPYTYR